MKSTTDNHGWSNITEKRTNADVCELHTTPVFFLFWFTLYPANIIDCDNGNEGCSESMKDVSEINETTDLRINGAEPTIGFMPSCYTTHSKQIDFICE